MFMRRTMKKTERKITVCARLIPLLVVYAISPLFISSAVSVQTAPPLYVYDEFVSICFFPFEKAEGQSDGTDIRGLVTSDLKSRDAFDYLFSFPRDSEFKTSHARAFYDRKGFRWPDPKYWSKTQIHYVVFGSYSITSEQLIAEVCLYDAQDDTILIYKRYRASTGEISALATKISEDMEQGLLKDPKNKRRIKHRDKPLGEETEPYKD